MEVLEEFLVVWRRSEEVLEVVEGEGEAVAVAEAKRAEEGCGGGTQRRVRAWVVFIVIAWPFDVGEKEMEMSFI